MRQQIVVGGHIAKGSVVFADRFGITRLLTEVTAAGSDGVECLYHSPPTAGHNHRVLHNVANLQIDVDPFFIFSFTVASDPLEQWDRRACLITHANASQILAQQRLFLCLPSFSCTARRQCGSRAGSKQ